MAIRFLDRIDAAIAAAPTIDDRNCRLARKSTYLAKVGRFEEARKIIEELRGTRTIYQNAPLSVLLTFADGVVAYYSDCFDEAQDRFCRSSALSKAIGLRDVSAFSCAWLAHLAFGRFDFDCLVSEMNQAFEFVVKEEHECLARICLVLAVTSHLAGQQDEADTWYARAHYHAVEEGDESTISSIMYNRTVMEIVNIRKRLIWKGDASSAARVAVSSAESTENFDKLVGIVSFGDFTPVLKAQTYSLAGRYADAESLYASSLSIEPSKSQVRSRCWLLSDRAFCLVRTGNLDVAQSVAHDATQYISDSVQVDDLASTHGRLAAVFEALGDVSRSTFHSVESKAFWEQFASLQDSVARRISVYGRLYGLLKESNVGRSSIRS